MKLLRRTLRWQAGLWALSGAALLVAPRLVVEGAMGQPSIGEDVWIRAAGLMAIALGGQMVLVGNRLEELWWWSWTFAILEIGTALVFAIAGLVGLPEGAPGWPWWAVGFFNGALGLLQIAALARAGTERSPV